VLASSSLLSKVNDIFTVAMTTLATDHLPALKFSLNSVLSLTELNQYHTLSQLLPAVLSDIAVLALKYQILVITA
jgi:hypothetical protein